MEIRCVYLSDLYLYLWASIDHRVLYKPNPSLAKCKIPSFNC